MTPEDKCISTANCFKYPKDRSAILQIPSEDAEPRYCRNQPVTTKIQQCKTFQQAEQTQPFLQCYPYSIMSKNPWKTS